MFHSGNDDFFTDFSVDQESLKDIFQQNDIPLSMNSSELSDDIDLFDFSSSIFNDHSQQPPTSNNINLSNPVDDSDIRQKENQQTYESNGDLSSSELFTSSLDDFNPTNEMLNETFPSIAGMGKTLLEKRNNEMIDEREPNARMIEKKSFLDIDYVVMLLGGIISRDVYLMKDKQQRRDQEEKKNDEIDMNIQSHQNDNDNCNGFEMMIIKLTSGSMFKFDHAKIVDIIPKAFKKWCKYQIDFLFVYYMFFTLLKQILYFLRNRYLVTFPSIFNRVSLDEVNIITKYISLIDIIYQEYRELIDKNNINVTKMNMNGYMRKTRFLEAPHECTNICHQFLYDIMKNTKLKDSTAWKGIFSIQYILESSWYSSCSQKIISQCLYYDSMDINIESEKRNLLYQWNSFLHFNYILREIIENRNLIMWNTLSVIFDKITERLSSSGNKNDKIIYSDYIHCIFICQSFLYSMITLQCFMFWLPKFSENSLYIKVFSPKSISNMNQNISKIGVLSTGCDNLMETVKELSSTNDIGQSKKHQNIPLSILREHHQQRNAKIYSTSYVLPNFRTTKKIICKFISLKSPNMKMFGMCNIWERKRTIFHLFRELYKYYTTPKIVSRSDMSKLLSKKDAKELVELIIKYIISCGTSIDGIIDGFFSFPENYQSNHYIYFFNFVFQYFDRFILEECLCKKITEQRIKVSEFMNLNRNHSKGIYSFVDGMKESELLVMMSNILEYKKVTL